MVNEDNFIFSTPQYDMENEDYFMKKDGTLKKGRLHFTILLLYIYEMPSIFTNSILWRTVNKYKTSLFFTLFWRALNIYENHHKYLPFFHSFSSYFLLPFFLAFSSFSSSFFRSSIFTYLFFHFLLYSFLLFSLPSSPPSFFNFIPILQSPFGLSYLSFFFHSFLLPF